MTLPFWIALCTSSVIAYPIYLLLLRVKSRQIVSEFLPDHQKKQGTPTMGGLIIILGVIVAIFSDLWMVLLIVLFGLIGFIDDFVIPRLYASKRGLGWMQKLVIQFLVALPVVYWSMNPSMLWLVVGSFLIVCFGNAFNFADGLDGLSGGILLFLAPGLIALSYALGITSGVNLGLGFVGAILPFLIMNAPPAKIFMGDVGSLPIGGAIGFALARITQTAFVNDVQPWLIVLATTGLTFLLLCELIPVPLQIASVKLRKKRLFPRTPIHHAFEHKGWVETRIVWLFMIVQAVCSMGCITISAAIWGRA